MSSKSIIQRTFHRPRAALQDTFASLSTGVGVVHGGLDVFVAEQFLHGANVVSILEQVGGKRMAEGVGGNMFVDLCAAGEIR